MKKSLRTCLQSLCDDCQNNNSGCRYKSGKCYHLGYRSHKTVPDRKVPNQRFRKLPRQSFKGSGMPVAERHFPLRRPLCVPSTTPRFYSAMPFLSIRLQNMETLNCVRHLNVTSTQFDHLKVVPFFIKTAVLCQKRAKCEKNQEI